MCLFVTKKEHFLLGVSCNHLWPLVTSLYNSRLFLLIFHSSRLIFHGSSFFMFFYGFRSVLHGSRLANIVFSRFQVDFCYGSRWNFMVFHGSRSVFHGSKWVFMIFMFQGGFFMVPGFLWFQVIFWVFFPGWLFMVENAPKGTRLICILAP